MRSLKIHHESGELVDLLNKKYAGKELLFCHTLQNTIDFSPDRTTFCSSCTTSLGAPIIYREDLSSFSSGVYFKSLERIMELNQTEKAPCKGCAHLKKQFVPLFKSKNFISGFTINNFLRCNSKCIYCGLDSQSPDYFYSILPVIKQMHEEKILSPNCQFIWGGGEPTIYKEFEDVVNYLRNSEYYQTINSSGLKFSPAIFNGLSKKVLNLQISVDSGTKDTYAKVKGQDGFERVWENIKRYCEFPEHVRIKYIIFAPNNSEEEVRAFIDQCIRSNVKFIEISLEGHQISGVVGERPWGKVTERDIEAHILMKNLAQQNNINVSISEIWSWDPEIAQKLKGAYQNLG